MSCSHEHDDHGHGHGHDHDHVPPPDSNEAQSLFSCISHDQITTLNESVADSGKLVFKPWQKRLDGTQFLESDADEQLIISVPFTGIVRLHSILVRSTADDSAPKTIKLFKNKDNLDFSSATELPATAEFQHPLGVGGQEGQEIEEDGDALASASSSISLESEGIVEYAVSRAHFSNLTNLTIFVEDNHGADTTKILYIGLRGEFTKMSRAPIVTMYEAAANPRDHKNLVPGEKYVSENA